MIDPEEAGPARWPTMKVVGQQSKFSYDALRASLMQRYSRCGSTAWAALDRSVPAEPIVQTRADSVDLGDLGRSSRDVHILDLRTQVRSKAVLDPDAQSGTSLATGSRACGLTDRTA
jgi:hypothetical protein